jgi:hypothetical protein
MWKLYLDDERNPFDPDVLEEDLSLEDKKWVVCRTSHDAMQAIKKLGLPEFMSLDYALGDSTAIIFLYWLKEYMGDNKNIPDYYVHSRSPDGRREMLKILFEWSGKEESKR